MPLGGSFPLLPSPYQMQLFTEFCKLETPVLNAFLENSFGFVFFF